MKPFDLLRAVLAAVLVAQVAPADLAVLVVPVVLVVAAKVVLAAADRVALAVADRVVLADSKVLQTRWPKF